MERINGGRVLLDSNCIIGILNGRISVNAVSSYRPHISAVTVMELYALAGMSTSEERRIDDAVALLEVIPVYASIAKCAGILSRIRRKRNKADFLIAATALEMRVPLVTRNIRDFKKIPNLKLQAI